MSYAGAEDAPSSVSLFVMLERDAGLWERCWDRHGSQLTGRPAPSRQRLLGLVRGGDVALSDLDPMPRAGVCRKHDKLGSIAPC